MAIIKVNSFDYKIKDKAINFMIVKDIYFCKCHDHGYVLACGGRNLSEGMSMSSEGEFFAELRPQIAEVIGTAVMQLLVEKADISRDAIVEQIQVLWQESEVDLPVEMALDVLTLPKE